MSFGVKDCVLAAIGFTSLLAGLKSNALPRLYFEDVTRRSGLELERVVAEEKKYIVESTGGGVAFLDYDNDGWLDVYVVNSPSLESFQSNRLPSNRLYWNNRDGTFTDTSKQAGVDFRGWGMGIGIGDYNNDGLPDIYLTNFGPNVLFRNNGDGTFTDVTKQAGVGDPRYSSSSGWADYDRDADLDLFVANYVELDLNRLPPFGEGKYCIYKTLQVQCGPRGLPGVGDTLYRNNGDGTFTDVSKIAGVEDSNGYYGLGVAWADLDDDAYPDLYVANDTNPNYLYWNQGDGTFRESGLLAGVAVDPNGKGQAGMGVAVGDYDNDGRLDLSVSNFSEENNALYHNRGSRQFEELAYRSGIGNPSFPYVGWGTFFVDLDNDGYKDLFVANGHVYPQVDRMDVGTTYRQRCLLFRNSGDGTFADVAPQAGPGLNVPRVHRGAAWGDYDNDGDLDILAIDLDGGPLLFENRTAPPGNYLWVKAPIGSKITVEAGELKQVEEVRASGSYQSASEQVAHFGLGKAARVERLAVRLPSGAIKEFHDPKINQTVTVD